METVPSHKQKYDELNKVKGSLLSRCLLMMGKFVRH